MQFLEDGVQTVAGRYVFRHEIYFKFWIGLFYSMLLYALNYLFKIMRGLHL